MIFEKLALTHLTLPNRVVRSATYEGYGDANGLPIPELGQLYRQLAENQVGTIITGFAYVSRSGRAMQPNQTSIASDAAISAWGEVIAQVRALPNRAVMLLQIAHAGLQTLPSATGSVPLSSSDGRSPYFGVRAKAMSETDIATTVDGFAQAARRAKTAGFDGIQLHAAHGYLIHQFLSPHYNHRKDRWGQDRFRFLDAVLNAIRSTCGSQFPILIKLSVPDGHSDGITLSMACEYATRMQRQGVEAIEVSYGTMDSAMDIFRGELPIDLAFRYNPFYKDRPRWALALAKHVVIPRLQSRLLPFTENYNLKAAAALKRVTKIPIILVGGLRRLDAMNAILAAGHADAIALCRPLICQPDLITQFAEGRINASNCCQCNHCAIMCDHDTRLRCYKPKKSGVAS